MEPRYMSEERMLDGITRLLAAPADLGFDDGAAVPLKQASEPHRKLFQKYRKDLKRVLDDAVQWWDHRSAVLEEELGNAKQARQANWREFPAGPVSDPTVVGVVRKYWLACAQLNAQAVPKVAPQQFMLQWIVDDGDMASAELLAGMPYWPIGLDGRGQWS